MKKIKIQKKLFKIVKSPKKDKQYRAINSNLTVDFGDPTMPEYPGTARGNSYCARSSGIKGFDDLNSPNFWSRLMWSCRGKKSTSKKKFFGRLK